MQDLSLQLPLTLRVDHRHATRDRPAAGVLRHRRRGTQILEPETRPRRGPAAVPGPVPVSATASPASAGQLYTEFSGTARCWIHAVSGI